MNQPSRKDGKTIASERQQAAETRDGSDPKQPMVSICCITYNHGKFISRALDGFLMQETSFPVEIIVHDDCSTDRTVQVIQNYQARYPGRIRTILQKENQYTRGKKIFPMVFDKAAGKYFTLCEGDDYWTDSQKLQRQVDYLESNADASGSFHNCVCVDEDDQELPNHYASRSYKPSYSQRDCLTDLRSSYATASLMFRGRVWTASTPPLYIRRASSDEMLDLLITEYGTLNYLPFTMSAYRLHRKGAWQGAEARHRARTKLEQFAALSQDPDFYRRHAEVVDRILRNQWLRYWRLSGGGIWRLPFLRTLRVLTAADSPPSVTTTQITLRARISGALPRHSADLK